MIDLYTAPTPNGRKVSIALEEMGIAYATHPVDITRGEQFAPEFLRISPNNRIPAIVDRTNGRSLMESGAILLYLAERSGQFHPAANRWEVLQWLMWQMGGLGPMLGQAHHFLHFNPGQAPYAEQRYAAEVQRLYQVLDQRLGPREFIAGDYSIADMASWPWIARFEWHGIDPHDYPAVERWYRAVAARPAVQRGYRVPVDPGPVPLPPEPGENLQSKRSPV